MTPSNLHWNSTLTIHIFVVFSSNCIFKHSRIFTVVVLFCWFSVRNLLEDNDLSWANSERNHSIVPPQSTGASNPCCKETERLSSNFWLKMYSNPIQCQMMKKHKCWNGYRGAFFSSLFVTINIIHEFRGHYSMFYQAPKIKYLCPKWCPAEWKQP